MPSFIAGQSNYSDFSSTVPTNYFGMALDWFINRTPLFARLGKQPVNSIQFKMVGYSFRPRTATLNTAAITDGTGTSFTFTDASYLTNGDILRSRASGTEVVEVTSVTSGTVVAVNRGVAGTTAAAIANATVFDLIGNSRTGGEVNQAAVSSKPTLTTQYVQSFQHVVSTAGILEAVNATVATGYVNPFGQERGEALQHLVDDVEYSSYYGVAEDPGTATSGRAKQAGFKSLLATNNTSGPTNASAYKPSDFVRDTIQKCLDNGGDPDLIIASTDMIGGLSKWTLPITRLQTGTTMFGQAINTIMVPLVGMPMAIVPAPLLKKGTAIVVSSREARYRVLRPVDWQPYGRKGDAMEGDWIASVALHVDNEPHHAWVEGITGYAQET